MPDSRECVNIRTEDGRMCASISGDIDHHSAREMRLRIDTAFAVSDAEADGFVAFDQTETKKIEENEYEK